MIYWRFCFFEYILIPAAADGVGKSLTYFECSLSRMGRVFGCIILVGSKLRKQQSCKIVMATIALIIVLGSNPIARAGVGTFTLILWFLRLGDDPPLALPLPHLHQVWHGAAPPPGPQSACFLSVQGELTGPDKVTQAEHWEGSWHRGLGHAGFLTAAMTEVEEAAPGSDLCKENRDPAEIMTSEYQREKVNLSVTKINRGDILICYINSRIPFHSVTLWSHGIFRVYFIDPLPLRLTDWPDGWLPALKERASHLGCLEKHREHFGLNENGAVTVSFE